MLRAMYSGISGLKNHQTKLDVIGNNISNVNTYGFKKSRVVFKDLVSQSISGASQPTAARGGVNMKQVGLGSQLAAIDTMHGTGSLQTTGRTLDLAISGDGFFMVADTTVDFVRYSSETATGEEPSDTGIGATPFTDVMYTRAGNFYMDNEGYLVDSEGKYLVGVSPTVAGDTTPPLSTDYPGLVDYAANEGTDFSPMTDGEADPWNTELWSTYADAPIYKPIRVPTDAQSMSIGQDGTISFVDANGELKWAGQLVMAKFSNTAGLEKTGGNYYTITANSGDPFMQVATVAGLGSIQSGFLEMSNVDLSEEFTEMIVAQRGFQANSRIITTSDEILQELVNLKR